ncbi:MAG: hypothetical protein RL557_915 [archaeon]|jgi:hypothetical protein
MGEVEDKLKEVSPYYKERGASDFVHTLIYDSPTEALEPLYFWILDFMGKIGLDRDKLVDNFASSPGSGHFSELGLKKSQMQEQAMRIMGTMNSILRSVLNLIYDLKEFKIRLSHYDAANSPDKAVKEAGILALKQIWMDKVDIQRGQGSINALSSGNLQFVTLRDAFLFADSPQGIDKMDLNDRVKRILKPRVQEFFEWKKRSEMELKKRYEIEKSYLKSQVSALKLQARWAKPYLRAAEKLMQSERLERSPALVTAFNTLLLELSLMGKREIKVDEAATNTRLERASLPEDFKHIVKKIRKYYAVVLVDFSFTGIPNKVGQNFVFGGRAEIKFKAYALNEDELKMLEVKLGDSDLESALKLVQGMTDDSIAQLKIDIDELLEDKKDEKKEVGDPFSSLFNFGLFKFKKKDENELKKEKLEKLKKNGVKKDSYAEAFVRSVALRDAMDLTFLIYDILKKNYGMASFPYGGEKGSIRGAPAPATSLEKFFGFR